MEKCASKLTCRCSVTGLVARLFNERRGREARAVNTNVRAGDAGEMGEKLSICRFGVA